MTQSQDKTSLERLRLHEIHTSNNFRKVGSRFGILNHEPTGTIHDFALLNDIILVHIFCYNGQVQ